MAGWEVHMTGLQRVLVGVICSLTGAVVHAAGPSVVVLRETGQTRDGLPVLELAAQQEPHASVLSRGVSGDVVRLWSRVQLASGSGEPEPAYLLLSGNQGGFPRTGFFLGKAEKRNVGYVDLIASSRVSGEWAADDQIFPHELWHLVLLRLAGEATGGCNQVHAVGVRTDPETAFNEGVAEAMQVLAVDDPRAEPETRALPGDTRSRAKADANLAGLRRELESRLSVVGRYRMTFPLWFSPTEQVQRYHAVKANLFARAPQLSDGLASPWDAWVLDSVLPGSPGDPLRSPGRLAATEGVVAAFAVRWLSSPAAQRLPAGADVVARWGLDGSSTPTAIALAKLAEAVRVGRTHTLPALVASWRHLFPEDAEAISAVLAETVPGSAPAAPPLWVATTAPVVGTSLFDQWRGAPRAHTFDLNAATAIDLMWVPGVDRATAAAIISHAPYASVAEAGRVPGVPTEVATELARMEKAMSGLRSQAEDDLSLKAILLPYLWRALAAIALVAAVATLIQRRLRGQLGHVRAILDGLGTALVGLLVGWLLDPGSGLVAWAAPALGFGVPAALLALRRSRREAGTILAAWALAALPVLLLVHPWF
jgi:hypothetical protein